MGDGKWTVRNAEHRRWQCRASGTMQDVSGYQMVQMMRRQRHCSAQISKDEKKSPGIACAIQIKLRFPLMWLVVAHGQHSLMVGSGKVSKRHGKLQRYLDYVRSRMVFCRKYKRTFPVLHSMALRWGLIVLISLYIVLSLSADSVFIASSLITGLGGIKDTQPSN